MKVKDLVLDEIIDMSVSEYLSVYQYIHAIKAIRPKPSNKKGNMHLKKSVLL